MGLFRKLLRGSAPIEMLRADLFMEYDLLTRTGKAAVQWVSLKSNDPNFRLGLIALLYARILIAHAETRAKLFELVGETSKQILLGEGQTDFLFPEWMLHVGLGAGEHRIWPWVLVDNPRALSKPKVYSATLLSFPETTRFAIYLKMAWGRERILAPGSPLIAISSYAQSTGQEDRYKLALLLWQVNQFYGSPDRVRMGSESEALAGAITAIRSYKDNA
jgi:hypothetical protein